MSSVSRLLVHIALCIIIALSVVQCDSGSTWHMLQVQCLPDSLAIHQAISASEIQCTILASPVSAVGLLVSQFRLSTGACSVFRYQSVCAAMIAGRSSDCQVFARFPIDPQLINAKLSNVWLTDGMSKLENLVCQIDESTNRFYPVSVQWNAEGAVFDGSIAHLALNKSSMNFSAGFTWLVRLKRQPRVQPFLEFVDCNNLQSAAIQYIQLWEYSVPLMGYGKFDYIGSSKQYRTASNQLPNSPTEWINFGLTSSGSGDSWNLFFYNAFLTNPTVMAAAASAILPTPCLYFGKRYGDATLFQGTLRAIGIANRNMSESEIRQFFDLVG